MDRGALYWIPQESVFIILRIIIFIGWGRMDRKAKKAINEFVERAKRLDIEKVILYGSAARGEYVPEKSDIDILIVGNRNIRDRLSDIGFDVGLENNVLITTIIKPEKKFKQELQWGSPFLKNVVEDGRTLYERDNRKGNRAG